MNGFARAQQPAPEKKDLDEGILLKLDPFMVNAIKLHPNDTPLRKLQKERCRERAVALAKLQTVIDIGKWNPTDFPDTLKISITLSENLLEVLDKPADKVKCYEIRLGLNIAKAARIDAEIELLKFKTEIEKPMK
jgi:hypothetical protein